jgi:hypothetical protein
MSTNNVHPIFEGLLSAIDPSPKKSKVDLLLDERWPLHEAENEENRKQYELLRLVFEQGYNAYDFETWIEETKPKKQ